MERVTVLNPASFGKLVRLVFPGLKTRRLGVRGESKYHYVDLMFKKESPPNRLSDAPTPARQMLDDAPQPPSFM
jgi:regulatory factor X